MKQPDSGPLCWVGALLVVYPDYCQFSSAYHIIEDNGRKLTRTVPVDGNLGVVCFRAFAAL